VIAPRTASARHRTTHFGARLLVAAALAAASRACLINPQKDYPVGARTSETGGNAADGGATPGPGQSSDGGESVGDIGGADGFGGAPDLGGAGVSSSAGSNSTACSDATECSIGEVCQAQRCQCTACPRGGLAGLPDNFCLAPVDAIATGSVASDEAPEQAIDGDSMTSWASGDYTGTLTLSFPTPQPVAAVVLVPRASPGVVDYTISVHDDGGSVEMLSAHFATTTSQTWLRVPLPQPAMVTDVTVDGRSTDSWISLWEVLIVPCPAN